MLQTIIHTKVCIADMENGKGIKNQN